MAKKLNKFSGLIYKKQLGTSNSKDFFKNFGSASRELSLAAIKVPHGAHTCSRELRTSKQSRILNLRGFRMIPCVFPDGGEDDLLDALTSFLFSEFGVSLSVILFDSLPLL
jgi:hypothetical protein